MSTGHRERTMSARTVDLLLNAAFGNQTSVARFEGLCFGNPMAPVTAAVVCYAPTVELLRRAVREGRNLIIAREHPLFLHGGLSYAYTSEGLLREDPAVSVTPAGSDRDLYVVESFDSDSVVAAKRSMMAEGGLVVYRHGSAWDQYRPAAQSAALARAIGLEVSAEDERARRRGVVCHLPHGTTLADLADRARTRLGSNAPRIVGDVYRPVHRVAVIAGETDPVPAFADLLADPGIDCVIAGAGGILDEVDGGIAYFLDVMGAGRPISLMTVGYGPSHEPGVREMAAAIAQLIPDLDLEYWPSGDPSWSPQRESLA